MTVLQINRDDFIEALKTQIDSLYGEGWFLDTETGEIWLHSDGIDIENYPEDFPESSRYMLIECLNSSEAFQIMQDFVEQLDDAEAATVLAAALKQSKPFRRFKDSLDAFPAIQDSWYAFERDEYTRFAERWCEERNIQFEWI